MDFQERVNLEARRPVNRQLVVVSGRARFKPR